MENIKLAGNRFPIVEETLLDDEKNMENKLNEKEEQFDDDAISEILPVVMSEEEKEERRNIMRKIMRYRTLFASELVDIDMKNITDKNLIMLRDMLRDIEFLVATRIS